MMFPGMSQYESQSSSVSEKPETNIFYYFLIVDSLKEDLSKVLYKAEYVL